MLLIAKTSRINAIDLHRDPGRLLDRADYRRESFVIERAGKPKAVLVPFAEFEQLRCIRQEAQERYFACVNELRDAFSDMSKQDIGASIEEAVQGARKR